QLIYRFYVVDDDAIVWPQFPLQWQIQTQDSHDGHNMPRQASKERSSGYAYIPVIKEIPRIAEEVAKMPHEKLTVDWETSQKQLNLANDIFGDILPPRIAFMPHHHKWTLGVGYDAVHLLGFNELIMALCENPDGVHALMAFLRDEWMLTLDFMERENLITPHWAAANGEADVTPNGKSIAANEKAKLSELWGFAECQEMVVASPQMFEEFIMPYVAPITKRFGYISYGCCEPLDDRLDIVRRYIPNVRKIGITAWANQEKFAGVKDLVLSRRPNPAMVCTRFNEDEIRQDIRKSYELLGQSQLEIILKDVVTLQNEADRIPRWVKIMREEIARHYGD
ncbi:MAG: hypothetical protein PHC61_18030, partial [Chitinivibrionales bacterium]|nr:hypothetical protein [Chitinivibrionales bacterium]